MKQQYSKQLENLKELHTSVGGIDNVTLYFEYKKFKLVNEFIKTHKKGKLLDVGSNVGHFCYLFKQHGFDVTGIDVNKKYIDISSQKFKDIEFIEASATKLPFPDETFDYVISFDVMEYIPDKDRAFSEVNRVLKKDGLFLCCLPNVMSYYFGRKAMFYIFSGRWNEHDNMTRGTVHFRFPSFVWMDYIKKANFKIVEVSSDILIPIEPKFMFYIKNKNPKLFSLIEKIENPFRKSYVTKYLGTTFNVICRKLYKERFSELGYARQRKSTQRTDGKES